MSVRSAERQQSKVAAIRALKQARHRYEHEKEHYHEAFRHAFREGLTITEIAETIGASRSTVYARLRGQTR